MVASNWCLVTHEFPHFVRFMACEESLYKDDLICSDVSPLTLVASIGGPCVVTDARSDGATRTALTEGAVVCFRNGAQWTVLRSGQGVEYFEGETADAVLVCADEPMIDAYWASNLGADETHPALVALLSEADEAGKRFWRIEQTH